MTTVISLCQTVNKLLRLWMFSISSQKANKVTSILRLTALIGKTPTKVFNHPDHSRNRSCRSGYRMHTVLPLINVRLQTTGRSQLVPTIQCQKSPTNGTGSTWTFINKFMDACKNSIQKYVDCYSSNKPCMWFNKKLHEGDIWHAGSNMKSKFVCTNFWQYNITGKYQVQVPKKRWVTWQKHTP